MITTQKTEVTEPINIPNENITNADKTTKELETQTIMIPSTDETQTSSTENDTVSSFSLQLASTSETILENSDKREHDNEELSFTTENGNNYYRNRNLKYNSTFKIIKIRVVYGNNGRGIILMLISIKINYFLINYFLF